MGSTHWVRSNLCENGEIDEPCDTGSESGLGIQAMNLVVQVVSLVIQAVNLVIQVVNLSSQTSEGGSEPDGKHSETIEIVKTVNTSEHRSFLPKSCFKCCVNFA